MARPSKTATQRGSMVTRAEIADLFGVATTTVDQWVRSGCPIVEKGSKGVPAKFNTAEVARWRVEKAAEDAGGQAKASEHELKLRKLAAETAKSELELAKAKGEVAPIMEFERVQAARMSSIRANLRNVPARAVMQLLGCTDESEFKKTLMDEINLALVTSAEQDIEVEEEEEQEEET